MLRGVYVLFPCSEDRKIIPKKTLISYAIRADSLGSIGLLKQSCIDVMTSLLFILVTKSSSFFPVVGPLGFLIGIDATTNSSVRSSYQSI
jgi:hypothetical protein